jgi:hypothetical protein
VPVAALPEPPPPPPEDTNVPARATESPRDTAGRVPWRRRVHLLTPDDRVELRRATNVLACRAPCDAVVEFFSGESFHLGGDGLADSASFTFQLSPDDVMLDVHPRSPHPGAGTGLAAAGGLVAVLGASGALLGVVLCQSESNSRGSCAATGLIIGSVVVGVAGIGLAMAGRSMADPHTEFIVR